MTSELNSRIRVLNGLADVFATPSGGNVSALGDEEWRRDIAETITASLKSATGEYVKEQFKGAAQELLRAVMEETAHSLVESIGGPLIRLAFRVVDTSGKKLDKLVAEPFTTGLRVGSEALNMRNEAPRDRELTLKRLQFALEKLDSAYTLTDLEDADGRFYIRLFQAFIASCLHSTAYTKLYFSDCLPLLVTRKDKCEQRANDLVIRSAKLRELAANRRARQRRDLFRARDGLSAEPQPWAEPAPLPEMRADYYNLDRDNTDPPAVLLKKADRCDSAASMSRHQVTTIQDLIAFMEAAANG
jgi:hypothetical protein